MGISNLPLNTTTNGLFYKVDITEGASAQFPTWIFNFGPYGQLRAVRGNIFNLELLPSFGGALFMFSRAFFKLWKFLSLEKIRIGWVLWCRKVQICKHFFTVVHSLQIWTLPPVLEFLSQPFYARIEIFPPQYILLHTNVVNDLALAK